MSKTNRERTEQTRQALISAARELFVEKGFADTATPDVVQAASVTRGALYHHFADKRALFQAVIVAESGAVGAEIENLSKAANSPREALLKGMSAYFDAMAVAGRTRLLLLEAPAVLGAEAIAIDGEHAEAALKAGLAEFMPSAGDLLGPLTDFLSAAFDRAALAIAGGADRALYERSMEKLLDGLADQLRR
jgi:AcrR family transcriptional regulator